MKITDLTLNDIVLCRTNEEADRILKIAHKAGFKWYSNASMLLFTRWDCYKEQTCYNIRKGTYGNCAWYRQENYNIIDSKDIQEMEEIKIEIPEGYEIDEENSTFEPIKFKKKTFKHNTWYRGSAGYIAQYSKYSSTCIGWSPDGKRRNDITMTNIDYWTPMTSEEIEDILIQELIDHFGENWKEVKVKVTNFKWRYIISAQNKGLFIPSISYYEAWNKNGVLRLGDKYTEVLKGHPEWIDLGRVEGYYINGASDIIKYNFLNSVDTNKNTFPSKEEAEACLALSQLLQWRDKYNEGWKPDWTDKNSTKYCILLSSNDIFLEEFTFSNKVLSFKSPRIRTKFLEDFKDLIEIAKPLL